MEKNILKNLLRPIGTSALMAVAFSLSAVSCMVQPGGYSETDGVYYDPNRDTLPQGSVEYGQNRPGEYYDYQDSSNILQKNRYNQELSRNRYKNWNNQNSVRSSSDWGNYTGSETNYYDSWSYPYGLGYGYGFGYSPFYGYYSPYYSGFGYGWGTGMYGWNYDPFWDFGFGFGYGMGYGYYGYPVYYSPYYYRGYAYGVPYRRSGATGGFTLNNYGNRSGYSNRVQNYGNQGFRGNNGNYGNRVYQNQNTGRVFTPQNRTYDQGVRSNSWNNDMMRSGGFRSGSDGGFRSSGGFGGGSGGGFRSGGGRSGGFR